MGMTSSRQRRRLFFHLVVRTVFWILHNRYVCPADVDPGSLGDDDHVPIYLVPPPPDFVRVKWQEVANIKGSPLRGAFWDGLEVPPCFRWQTMLACDEAGFVLTGAEFVH